MQWDLAGSLLGVRQRDREARWEHVGRSPEEDRKTHRKNVGGYQISGRFLVAELLGMYGLHSKKISSGCRYASRRRTWEWT
ncbi:hypothetical protein BHE74_00028916 [Ensete ventricosum]|nr:hypothetical protein GW17_00047125 [Ensete ventricosum]RWW63882.1 hypothetical protein BHE74_00028916 [Ensete ventricosum]RZS00919.1 hypothetical protein BHM03_00030704 [Ensete ventricosum]